MTISLFSGQGSQYPGMGKDVAESDPALMNIFETGSEILGRDLKEICFSSSAEELSRTINAQPAIMSVSLACLGSAVSKGYTYDGVAGHSLGEYAAMQASGMISLEDAFILIKARAEAMDEAARSQKGTMAAIMKIAPDKVAEVSEVFKEMGARVIPLNVAGAFHSKLMQTAADKFYETAKTIKYKTPDVKYYSNVTGGELTDFSGMAEIIAKHIVSPVRFTSELKAMNESGADKFVEFGPGKTLTGLVKKTLSGVQAVNAENLSTIEGAAAL